MLARCDTDGRRSVSDGSLTGFSVIRYLPCAPARWISQNTWHAMTDEAEAIVLRRAKASDIDDIAAIYRSCIGIAGTTWNEYYPLRRDAERDLAVNGLYVAEVGGTTVGCVSVIRSELEALAGWRMRGDGVLELSRLAVRPDPPRARIRCGYYFGCNAEPEKRWLPRRASACRSQ